MMPRRAAAGFLAALALGFGGCEQLFDKGSAKDIELADKRSAAGDFAAAVRLYEAALDGTAKTAEVHYKLALLYADKIKSPVDAVHHFDRYLAMAPAGAHAREARDFRKDAEQKLFASLGDGSPFITQEDAVALKKKNLDLTKALSDLRAQRNATPAPLPPGAKKGDAVQKPIPAGARTHTVVSGETFASIAQKYYKSKARAREIQDANFYPMAGTPKIKPGMVLMVP
jgi:hypothetical protein